MTDRSVFLCVNHVISGVFKFSPRPLLNFPSHSSDSESLQKLFITSYPSDSRRAVFTKTPRRTQFSADLPEVFVQGDRIEWVTWLKRKEMDQLLVCHFRTRNVIQNTFSLNLYTWCQSLGDMGDWGSTLSPRTKTSRRSSDNWVPRGIVVNTVLFSRVTRKGCFVLVLFRESLEWFGEKMWTRP